MHVQTTEHCAVLSLFFQFSVSGIHWQLSFQNMSSRLFGIQLLDIQVRTPEHRGNTCAYPGRVKLWLKSFAIPQM